MVKDEARELNEDDRILGNFSEFSQTKGKSFDSSHLVLLWCCSNVGKFMSFLHIVVESSTAWK